MITWEQYRPIIKEFDMRSTVSLFQIMLEFLHQVHFVDINHKKFLRISTCQNDYST